MSYGGWGLYNDQTTTSVTHTNNSIHNTEDSCCNLTGELPLCVIYRPFSDRLLLIADHDHEGYNVTLSNNARTQAICGMSIGLF